MPDAINEFQGLYGAVLLASLLGGAGTKEASELAGAAAFTLDGLLPEESTCAVLGFGSISLLEAFDKGALTLELVEVDALFCSSAKGGAEFKLVDPGVFCSSALVDVLEG